METQEKKRKKETKGVMEAESEMGRERGREIRQEVM